MAAYYIDIDGAVFKDGEAIGGAEAAAVKLNACHAHRDAGVDLPWDDGSPLGDPVDLDELYGEPGEEPEPGGDE